MLKDFLDFTNNVAKPIGIRVGLTLAVPVFWTWIDLVPLRGRRHRRWFGEVARNPGQWPAILIVDLKPDAEYPRPGENFHMAEPALKDIPEARIGLVFRDKPLAADGLPDLIAEVRNRGADFMRQGVDTIRLFYAPDRWPP